MNQGVFLRPMAEKSDECVIDIIGIIGWSVAYQQMRDIIRAIPETVKKVAFDIYSPGGDVWEGNGIVQEIGELGKRCETVAHVQVAASMATLITVACKTRVMAANGRFLIHNAWTQTIGDAAAHEKAAKTLHDCEVEAAKFYATRTGKTEAEMVKLMSEERWLTAEEAKSLGFVQDVADPFKEEKFDDVKKEIVAAGKWPKALVEMPIVEVKKTEEVKNDGPTNTGAAVVETVVTPLPVAPTNVVAVQPEAEKVVSEYDKGVADGKISGRSETLNEFLEQINTLKAKLAAAQAEASKYQSEKDKLAAQLVTDRKAADDRAAALVAQIKDLTDRLARLVAGALTFQPDIETWEDAMRECAGDYAQASKKYPQLREKYVIEKKGRK